MSDPFSDDPDDSASPDSLRISKAPMPLGMASRLHWIEILIALWSLILAGWQLSRVDRGLAPFALMWMAPPISAIFIRVRGHRRAFLRAWSALYLILLSVGDIVASNPNWLSHIKALHPAATEFAVRWNKLDIVSRRIFAWNMVLACASIFCLPGYFIGWRNLHDRVRFGRSELSIPTALLALFVFWLLPGISFVWLLMNMLIPK